ncbi:translation initiation factor eIF4A [Entomortierella chlamydospora]|nr:translation initiation factor eIF4A [Entomortierella chlamydospora]
MSQTTLAELSISLTNVQSLLKQITAEVKVLSDGIAVLVEQEEAEDLEEELNYLDVDPWSKVKDKDKDGAKTSRQDSVRSLMQRKPSTVKDETKALARILSQKRPDGNGSESERQQQQAQQTQQQQSGSRWSNLSIQDQTIDEDYASSEGSSSYRRGKRYSPIGEKQELDSASDFTPATITSVTSGGSPSPTQEAERVPHTITVQTTPMPTKFSIAITKPTTPQSPSTPILSASSSQSSILSSMNNHNATASGTPPFWRSSTTPNMGESSRPTSAIGNLSSDGYSTRSSVQNITQRRSVLPESRNTIDSQTITNSVKDRYAQALRSNSQGAILHPPVGKDTSKSIFTINSPKPMVTTPVEKLESADCFSKLGLIPELLRGIYAYGLKMPSILQQRGIPMIMTRHDVLTQAKPEVAKTLTYVIPLLNFLTLPATSIHPQLLILCSNNELCLHVQRVLLALARFMPTISCLICAEGHNATLSLGTMSSTKVNVAGLAYRNGQNGHGSRGSSYSEPPQVIAAHVVIGTPGNVLNLIRTKQISISALKVMVLENADILLATPLKEATISLLSMVRDPSANANGSGSTAVSDSPISPPNSGPTSPVSMAVAALNGRIMGSSSSSNHGSNGGGGTARFPGAYTEPESRPRSMSGASGTISSTPTAITNQPQLLFFSTDVPSNVLDYVAQYMTQPTKALVKGHELALKGILQFFKYMTVEDEEWQLELLCDLLEDSGVNRAVVFCNKDDSVEQVVRKVRERKGFAIGIYSDMDIATRKAALGRFKATPSPVYLVLTDEATKDLDIFAVSLVVSFEIPNINNYIPRVKWIDRTKGKLGAKVTLVDGHKGEGQILRTIQQHYKTTIDDMPASIAEFIIS